jgi:hypothetical protein
VEHDLEYASSSILLQTSPNSDVLRASHSGVVGLRRTSESFTNKSILRRGGSESKKSLQISSSAKFNTLGSGTSILGKNKLFSKGASLDSVGSKHSFNSAKSVRFSFDVREHVFEESETEDGIERTGEDINFYDASWMAVMPPPTTSPPKEVYPTGLFKYYSTCCKVGEFDFIDKLGKQLDRLKEFPSVLDLSGICLDIPIQETILISYRM